MKHYLRLLFILLVFHPASVLADPGHDVGPYSHTYLYEKNPELAKTIDEQLESIRESIHLMYSRYHNINGIPEPMELIDHIGDTLVDKIDDKYGRFILDDKTDARLKEFRGDPEIGIGSYIRDVDDKYLSLYRVFKDSPAHRAGLQDGDVILKINDVDLSELNGFQDRRAKLVGKIGSPVRLQIKRASGIMDVSLHRDLYTIPTMFWTIRDDILIIRINGFNQNSAKEMNDIIGNLPDLVSGIILDVRDNPGGSLYSSLEITKMFLPENSLLIEVEQNGETKQYRDDNGILSDVPVMVLVNEYSASASEILAGTLQSYGHTVVGRTTFGKGSIQTIFKLSTGSLTMTTGTYSLGKNLSPVDKVGIIPDIMVSEIDSEKQEAGPDTFFRLIDMDPNNDHMLFVGMTLMQNEGN